MSEAKDIAALSKEVKIEEQCGMPIAFIPPDHKIKELGHLLEKPLHVIGNPEFLDAESFGEYYKEMAEDDDKGVNRTRIFVDDRVFNFEAVFDSNAKDDPGHGRNRASLRFFRSHEWEGFKGASGSAMNRQRFARFLEQNIDYIVGDFSGIKLLDMCRKLKIRVKGDIDVTEDMAAGERGLTISGNQAVSGGDQSIPFPEVLKVNLRIFKHCHNYELEARLNWNLDHGEIQFTFDIVDPEGVEEKAFNEVIKDVESAAGKKPIRGKY